MREDLKDTYKTLSDYDRHYSTVRATGVIFLFGVSFSIASFLLTSTSGLLKDPLVASVASMIPFLFLVTAFLLSCHFQRLTYACRMYMEGIERTSNWSSSYRVEPRIDQCRINLDRLVKWRKIFEREETARARERGDPESVAEAQAQKAEVEARAVRCLHASLGADQDLPRFINFDLPNWILILATGLLLFLPTIIALNFLWPPVVAALIVIGLLILGEPIAVEWRYIAIAVAVVFVSLVIWVYFHKEPLPVCHSGIKSIGSPLKVFDPQAPSESDIEHFEGLISAIDNELYDKLREGCPLPMTMFVVGVINKQGLEGEYELDADPRALARAKYIKDKIRNRLSMHREIEILSMVAGSSWYSSKNNGNNKDTEMARDGSVAVYGLWAVKQGEGSRASKINN